MCPVSNCVHGRAQCGCQRALPPTQPCITRRAARERARRGAAPDCRAPRRRLTDLVVLDARGSTQPLEHLDFGDAELFFSGAPAAAEHFRMPARCLCRTRSRAQHRVDSAARWAPPPLLKAPCVAAHKSTQHCRTSSPSCTAVDRAWCPARPRPAWREGACPCGLSPRAVAGVLAAGAAPGDKSVRVASVGPITAWSICYAAPSPQARPDRARSSLAVHAHDAHHHGQGCELACHASWCEALIGN